MSDRTGVEWADATWSPIIGCSPASEGCANCYAKAMAKRLAAMGTRYKFVVGAGGTWNGDVHLENAELDRPLRWRKPRRVFCCSMGDLFHDAVPVEWIGRVFDRMCSATLTCRKPKCQHDDPECWQGEPHTFIVLTKRPERMRSMIQREIGEWACDRLHGDSCLNLSMEVGNWPPRNIWLGVTAENQPRFDERVGILADTPAVRRFVSLEPLLGPVTGIDPRLDWVVVGPETGPRRRPCNPEWIRSVVEQCKASGVPCFVKAMPLPVLRVDRNLDEHHGDRISHDPAEWPEWARVREWPS